MPLGIAFALWRVQSHERAREAEEESNEGRSPGPVWTPLNPADSPADKVAEFGTKTQMKRAAQPGELSPVYVFLASPVCSSSITGIVLPVTGTVSAI